MWEWDEIGFGVPYTQWIWWKAEKFHLLKEDATSFRYSVLVLHSVAWLISDVSLFASINYVNDLCLANPIFGRLVCKYTCVTWQGIYYKLHENDTLMSKHVGVLIICEIIVHLLFKIQNTYIFCDRMKYFVGRKQCQGNPFLPLHFQHPSVIYYWHLHVVRGHAVAQLFEALHYKPEGRRFDSRWGHWNFSLTILPVALWPWGDSASNRNEYQEYFLGVKAAGA